MAVSEASSEAVGEVQEPGGARVPGGTTTPAASEAGPGVQEPPRGQGDGRPGGQVSAPETGEGPPPEEIARRQRQSEIDREVNRRLLLAEQRRQQEAALQADQRRLAAMDNEEFGAQMRQRLAQAQVRTDAAQQAQLGMAAQLQQEALSAVADPKARAAIEARVRAGEFQSWNALFAACSEANVQAELSKTRSRLEKEIREAVTKERTAAEANAVTPQTGAGVPTSSLPRNATAHQRIRAGLDFGRRQ